MSNSTRPHGLKPARLLSPWDSPGKNTGMGCHALQGIFLTQGFEPASPVFPALQADSLPLEPLGKPRLSLFSYFLYSWDSGICGLPDIRVCFSQSQPVLRDSKELNQSMPFVYKPTNGVMLSFPFIIIFVPLFMQVQAQWPGNCSRGWEPENIFHSGLCMYECAHFSNTALET